MEHHFNIEGMTCGSCAARIQAGLQKSSVIEQGTVNFAMKTGFAQGTITETEIIKTVHDLGYEAIFLEKKLTIDELEKKEFKELSLRKKYLIISSLLTIPVFLSGMGFISFPGDGYMELVLTTLVMAFPGRSFYQVAWRLLWKKSANMDSLVAMGTSSAWLYSVFLLFTSDAGLYFESAAVIVSLVLVGKYLEENAKHSAAGAIRSLSKLQPKTAVKILEDGVESIIPIEDLKLGDIVLVRSGEKVPTDGEVHSGSTEFDESLISGESLPVTREASDLVTGGTINVGSRPVRVKVSQVGSDTVLAQIIKLVEDAQSSKPEIQNLADRISLYFVPAALLIASSTFLIWYFVAGASFADALIPAVAVLVIACPCALGLATPAAIVAATGRAAELHILIRSSLALEKAEKLKKVIFDKTGTLTLGKPKVEKIILEDQFHKLDVLNIAYSLEMNSQHPLARGICQYCKSENSSELEIIEAVDFEEIAGKGLKAEINGKSCLIGKKQFLSEQNIELPESWKKAGNYLGGIVYLAIDRKPAIAFFLQDPIRDTAIKAARRLEGLRIGLVLATGDRKEVAEDVARKIGITEVHSEMLPNQKLDLVSKLKKNGDLIAMVGDGINDAPALAKADVGIALGSGTDVAMSAASLVLPKGDLSRVAEAILLSKETLKIIRQNLFWAFAYNMISIPFAAMGMLSPMIAAGAMALSSVSVVLNSLRLRNFKANLD